MKPEILVLVPIYAPTLAQLERDYTVRKMWTEKDPDTYLKKSCGRVRGVVTTGLKGFSRRQIEVLPALEIIACFGNPHGAALEPVAAAAARGIVVTNTPDAISGIVADLAMGLIVSVMRRITEGDRYIRAGRWTAGPIAPGRDIGGKTCGIIGMGRIGREIAARAAAFGMRIRYHGPRPKPEVSYPFDADLEALARQSDCLVVICPETPATRGMVDARVLEALGPDGFLINVARGPIVNQEALVSALRDKRIAGAALDVFWNEPAVPPELMKLDNV